MKKVLVLVFVALFAVGCEAFEPPEGFDSQYHSDAKGIFSELDDDTAEGERPDRDDTRNMNRHFDRADSDREKEYVSLMKKLIEENNKIVDDIEYSTATYEDIREDIADILEITVYEFEFTEEDE
jgi:hypothetical protein